MAVVYWRGWYMLLGMSPSGVLVGQCERYDNMLRVNVLLLVGSDLAGSCCFVVGFFGLGVVPDVRRRARAEQDAIDTW